jgi:hypothetical protein
MFYGLIIEVNVIASKQVSLKTCKCHRKGFIIEDTTNTHNNLKTRPRSHRTKRDLE